ncbi:MAG: helix-turn-helix domain-containing protein [Syntrophobacteraceae bacterium]
MQENQEEIGAVAALMIGTQVRELREKNRYTLLDLAAKTGLDREMLARIESHEFIPPIASLVKLAGALNVSVAYFFQDKTGSDKIAVTRREERVRITRRPHHLEGEVDYIYESLEIRKARKQMEPFMVEFPVQETSEMIFMSHEGEEFLYLLEGVLEFRTVDQVEILNPGDSMYFESDVSHSLRCLGDTPAKAIAVVWRKS